MPSYPIRNAKGVGAAIRHARTARGIRQEDLAAQLGIRPAYLVAIEKGAPTLWATRVFRAFARLGITVTVSFDVPGEADTEGRDG